MAKRKLIYKLKKHELEVLQQLQAAVTQAQSEVNKTIYLLIGPKEFRNPTLKIDLETGKITVDKCS